MQDKKPELGRNNKLESDNSLRWCGIINGKVWDNELKPEWDIEAKTEQDIELDSLPAESQNHRISWESMGYPKSFSWP